MTYLFNLKNFALSVLMTTSVFAFSQISQDGLVAYYPFNGNANDESGNGNNGTVNGPVLTEDRFGNPNSAYSFDGVDDYIMVMNSTSLQNISEITISSWVNIKQMYFEPRFGGYFYPIVTKSDTQFNWGNFEFMFGFGGLTAFLLNEESTVAIEEELNIWQHVAVTINNGITKFYMNGVKIFDSNSGVFPASNPQNSSMPLQIGRNVQGYGEYANGKIDDIGIWNRALTDEEINDLFNEGICYQTITVTDTLIIDVTTLSYNPITYLNRFTVYPNPTHDMITIDNGDYNKVNGYAVEIKNSLAQSMFYSEVNQQQFTVDISTWSTGMYFIHIYNDSGHMIDIRKIILE
ncbi:LamG-like jellyroll fold domain-containing protein [Tamlana flava]|uniref:LamG-like jellyroll fold domain-containing protein n=1 Tax=Tamlana flava TaxID=3158572 RepID=UPI00351B19F7